MLPFLIIIILVSKSWKLVFNLTCNQIPSWEKAKKHVSSIYKTKNSLYVNANLAEKGLMASILKAVVRLLHQTIL